MPPGAIERRILNWLARPGTRDEWHDTRAIATEVHGIEWPDQAQIAQVRASLNRLQKRGLVERFGFMAEWKLAESAQGNPPRLVRRVLKALSEGAVA
ncbi:MAG: hypothetical protein HYT80_10875 [Euryarchaeota archaeon]|nr:hypothetical protein [Euryarchaeota archaeon]